MNTKVIIGFLLGFICSQLLVGLVRAGNQDAWGKYDVNKVISLLEKIEQNTNK